MSFDVVPETWAKTKLGALKVEDRVNLERALRADGRFDGHVVQGHIEGTAEVVSVSPEGEGVRMTLHIPLELVPFVVPKGSIALDGVSLTVAQAKSSECSVALIPTTLRETTLGGLEAGDTINIETDIFLRALLHAKR
jgi:riboflavin synthase